MFAHHCLLTPLYLVIAVLCMPHCHGLQLLPACLSVLPHLVRLLSAADAAAAGAGVAHGSNPAAAAGSAGYRALLGLGGEAGDSRFLQQVPLVLAQLMQGR
jgi:hypothetical protein